MKKFLSLAMVAFWYFALFMPNGKSFTTTQYGPFTTYYACEQESNTLLVIAQTHIFLTNPPAPLVSDCWVDGYPTATPDRTP